MTARIFSYGGGVQSTAALVLAARGALDFGVFCFANTGDDSENPDTLAFVREHAIPFAEQHGIELVERRREWRDGRDWTLLQELYGPTRRVGIPIRMAGSGAPGRRACTEDYKINVVAKLMRERGATRAAPGVVGLGISVDEFKRMRSSSGIDYYTLEYPLVDLRLNRSQCVGVIERAGLPVPPKSSCFFCPYHSLSMWRELREQHPDLFERAKALEEHLIAKRAELGRDPVYLTDRLVPLAQAVGDGRQLNLFDDPEPCESGYCMI